MGWFKPKPKPPVAPTDPTKPRLGFHTKGPASVPTGDTAIVRGSLEAATKLANTTPVAPPPTSLIASTNVDLARVAAERMRKRASGGLLTGAAPKPGPRAKLQPKTLIGY